MENLQKIELNLPDPNSNRYFNKVKFYLEDGDVWVEIFKRDAVEVNDFFGIRNVVKKLHFKFNVSKSQKYNYITWDRFEKIAQDLLSVKDSLYICDNPEGPGYRYVNNIIINDDQYFIYYPYYELPEKWGLDKLGIDIKTLANYFVFSAMSLETLSELQDIEICTQIEDEFDNEKPDKYKK